MLVEIRVEDSAKNLCGSYIISSFSCSLSFIKFLHWK